ncbi:tyrosine-type recombinase/integrase [Vibrio mediterranei]|uniref:tyrosine-type recombinase/integrase n=1 Tax=Vibrio mediterranei TaxID=689 RepID=UPI001EFE3246|nr:tyrosine-type recombinase/integrase [Vibrio mediterranei]MCG9627423.1 tyrosine-type recombinase/integrase [Vibrio mediterranei]
MYLFKTASHNYYTRICLPKCARDRGFPFDLKISLLTKDRRLASLRNLTIAIELKHLIESITPQTTPLAFKQAADTLVNELRSAFDDKDNHKPLATVPIRQATTVTCHQSSPVHTTAIVSLKDALASFVESKALQSIKPLTIHQLNSRIHHFIDFVSEKAVGNITTAHALRYRDELLKQGRSPKTNKDFLAACFQFFKYCKLMNHTNLNPFEDVKVSSKASKRHDEQRKRWTLKDLTRFFHAHQFENRDTEFQWISRLLLLSGARPSEICQLKLSDIQCQRGIHYFSINDSDEEKSVKNVHSLRQVPIHNTLIKLGFLDYVSARKARGHTQLFSYVPANQFDDWSKSYCSKMGKYQTAIGMKAGQRPTAYGFRHTFIDELKQQGVPEHVTAQIVGHSNNSMTYGRYGKRLSLSELANVINKIHYDAVFDKYSLVIANADT